MTKNFLFLVFAVHFLCFAPARHESHFEENPKTILWKISGNGLKKPSYLLGTHHLVDSTWLFQFPKIKAAIDNSEFLLNEAFSTDYQKEELAAASTGLKAVSLLSTQQYQTLDSFFVARVGEGIRNNPEAEAMNVPEMWNTIMSTLVMNRAGANGVSRLMDKDIFDYFVSKGKKADHLDKIKDMNFDSSRIDDARKVMRQAINLIPGSDKPGWNIYSRNVDIQQIIDSYKKMNAPYDLEKADSSDQVPDNRYGFETLEQRNRYWLPKIEKHIAGKSCLIAVGFGHLKYKTGVIVLLRQRGYRVEAVL